MGPGSHDQILQVENKLKIGFITLKYIKFKEYILK